jgi:hypothetical protein
VAGFASDPLCLIDPACLNPMPTAGPEGRGFALNEFNDMNEIDGLAIPNLLLFSTLVVGVCALIGRRVAAHRQWLALGCVSGAAIFEVARWFAQIPPTVDGSELVALLTTYALVLALVVLGTRLGRRGYLDAGAEVVVRRG